MGWSRSPLARWAVRYWGWIAVAFVFLRITRGNVDGYTILLALVSLVYFSFAAPAWCGAVTRGDQLCRNNAYGVLMGIAVRPPVRRSPCR